MTQTDKMQANEPPKPSLLNPDTKLGDLAVKLDLEAAAKHQDKYLIDSLVKFQRLSVTFCLTLNSAFEADSILIYRLPVIDDAILRSVVTTTFPSPRSSCNRMR